MKLKIILFVLCVASFSYGQVDDYFKSKEFSLERMFYSKPYQTLQDQIYDVARRHAIYSYIISNLTTPGFDFYAYLPPDDQAALSQMLPDDTMTNKVITEFMMTRVAYNGRRYSALMTMWGGKKNSLTKVVTLGK